MMLQSELVEKVRAYDPSADEGALKDRNQNNEDQKDEKKKLSQFYHSNLYEFYYSMAQLYMQEWARARKQLCSRPVLLAH